MVQTKFLVKVARAMIFVMSPLNPQAETVWRWSFNFLRRYSTSQLLSVISLKSAFRDASPPSTLHTFFIKMPPERVLMTPISGNRKYRGHLSLYTRTRIIESYNYSFTPAAITLGFNLIDSTIRYTLKLDVLRNKNKTQPKAPRAKSYTDADERLLLRHIRLNPKDTYTEVKTACRLTCSTTTIKKILKEYRIMNQRAKRRLHLTDDYIRKRLNQCLARRGWIAEEWGLYIQSDKCSIKRGRGKNQEWVFRIPDQKWDREMIQTYDVYKNLSIIVWGCFQDLRRLDLYILDRDFKSKKYRYSANLYLKVLNSELLLQYNKIEDNKNGVYIFIQDNAPIYTIYKVRDQFIDNKIITTNQLLYSPNLNLIEYIQQVLQNLLVTRYPGLLALKGESEQDIINMQEALQDYQAQIPKVKFDTLY